MTTVVWYFLLAAGVAAVLRYLADFYLPRRGILLVNILGSCFAGVVGGLAWHSIIDERIALVLLGGFAGSLTTFSTVALTAARQRLEGTGNVVKTWLQHVGLSSLACYIGLVLTVAYLL